MRNETRAFLAVFLTGFCLAVIVAASLAGCGDEPRGRPSVLLITVDTLRADHLSAYGFRDRKTPRIDALAAGGALFDFAHTDVTWTTPAIASTFTGTFAVRHGLRSYYDVLPGAAKTLAEILREAGYRTGAVVAAYAVDSAFGLDQGFETYDDDFTEGAHLDAALPEARTASWRPDDEVTDAAVALLDEIGGGDAPFFLWVHYYGPHDHWDPALSASENLEHHAATYADKIVNTDAEVGRLLAYLEERGLADRTLVVLHADHGESLGERGFIGHGRYLFENTLRVPLILRWPERIPAGERFGALVGNVDIAPTVLEAVGLDGKGSAMDGRSLFPLIRGEPAIHAEMYAETYLGAHKAFAVPALAHDGTVLDVGVRMRGVLRPPWKYVLKEAYPFFDREGDEITPEVAYKLALGGLYDLSADPDESENLLETRSLVALSLRESLLGYEDLQPLTRDTENPSLPADHLEKLRSLGYAQ